MKQFDLLLDDNNVEVYINGDPTRNIVFNPSGIGFVERYIDLGNFAKTAPNNDKYKSLTCESTEEGFDGTLNALQSGVDAYKLFFDDLCVMVDSLFGENACSKACQGQVDVDIIVKLLEGLALHIEQAHNNKVNKYIAPVRNRKQSTKK